MEPALRSAYRAIRECHLALGVIPTPFFAGVGVFPLRWGFFLGADMPVRYAGLPAAFSGIFEHLEDRFLNFLSATAHWPHVLFPHDLPRRASGAFHLDQMCTQLSAAAFRPASVI
jgi:hypothetical protein